MAIPIVRHFLRLVPVTAGGYQERIVNLVVPVLRTTRADKHAEGLDGLRPYQDRNTFTETDSSDNPEGLQQFVRRRGGDLRHQCGSHR